MRVLVDTNIFLDFLLKREPFLQDADLLFEKIGGEQITAFSTATTLTDIFYITRKHTQSFAIANQAVAETLAVSTVCAVNREISELALLSQTPDFEDAIQIACAVVYKVDAVVTRDVKGFAKAPMPVLSIRELLAALELASNGNASG